MPRRRVSAKLVNAYPPDDERSVVDRTIAELMGKQKTFIHCYFPQTPRQIFLFRSRSDNDLK